MTSSLGDGHVTAQDTPMAAKMNSSARRKTSSDHTPDRGRRQTRGNQIQDTPTRSRKLPRSKAVAGLREQLYENARSNQNFEHHDAAGERLQTLHEAINSTCEPINDVETHLHDVTNLFQGYDNNSNRKFPNQHVEDSTTAAVDEWQRQIQRNFQEFTQSKTELDNHVEGGDIFILETGSSDLE